MFSVECPDHGCEVLLSERRIRSLVPTPAGILMEWECWCGHVGATLTGRPLTAPTSMIGQYRPAM